MSKDVGDDHHCNFEVGKTSLADISTFAASSHIIIIIHINIKHHLFVGRNKGLLVTSVVSVWRDVVHGTNVDLVWDPVDKGLLELLSCFKAQITAVDVIRKSKGKLSVVEV